MPECRRPTQDRRSSAQDEDDYQKPRNCGVHLPSLKHQICSDYLSGKHSRVDPGTFIAHKARVRYLAGRPNNSINRPPRQRGIPSTPKQRPCRPGPHSPFNRPPLKPDHHTCGTSTPTPPSARPWAGQPHRVVTTTRQTRQPSKRTSPPGSEAGANTGQQNATQQGAYTFRWSLL